MAETYEFKERMLLTEDGRAVPSGDPEGVSLLGVPGSVIPMAVAKELGLVKPPPKPKPRRSRQSENTDE